MKVTIYGSSDDLIELEGDINEEFTYNEDFKNVLAFSDGTLLSVNYGDVGIWRITPIRYGSAKFTKTEGTDIESDYSDRVVLEGEFSWVVLGRVYVLTPARQVA